MGGPSNLDEVDIFLKNMFRDKFILDIKSDFLRNLIAALITRLRSKRAKKNYKLLGSRSRISLITEELCKFLNKNSDTKFDFAMNYTAPFFKDVIKKYANYSDIILFPLYPHYSITTIKSSLVNSLNEIKKLKKDYNVNPNVKIIDFFYKDFKYNKIIIKNIKKALSNVDPNEVSLIFSAHSLPVKVIKKGDKYEKHIKDHFKILKAMLKDNFLDFKEILLSYQSKLGPIKWLEPSLDYTLRNLKNKKVLIYPLSFCIDNSETDFELNIEYRALAKELEFDFYKVCECPNVDSGFCEYILEKSNL